MEFCMLICVVICVTIVRTWDRNYHKINHLYIKLLFILFIRGKNGWIL